MGESAHCAKDNFGATEQNFLYRVGMDGAILMGTASQPQMQQPNVPNDD
jgi:hypothetical protein